MFWLGFAVGAVVGGGLVVSYFWLQYEIAKSLARAAGGGTNH